MTEGKAPYTFPGWALLSPGGLWEGHIRHLNAEGNKNPLSPAKGKKAGRERKLKRPLTLIALAKTLKLSLSKPTTAPPYQKLKFDYIFGCNLEYNIKHIHTDKPHFKRK